MSWFTKYFLHPAAAAITTDPAVSADVKAATTDLASATHAALGGATGPIDAEIDKLTSGVEGLVDAFLANTAEGKVTTAAANFTLNIGAQAAKAAIDAKLAALVSV